MTKSKIFKVLTLYLSISLLLLGCASTNNKDASLIQASTNQPEVSPKITLAKVETANAGVSISGSTKTTDTKNNLIVHFIDVGQGASQLIISPNGKTILIDAGNNDKEKIIVAYLFSPLGDLDSTPLNPI